MRCSIARSWILHGGACACVCVTPALVWGAETPAGGRNPAAAQALFDEAQRLVTAGDLAAACPKFMASYELDAGGGTLLNLADCWERQGRTATAWSTFKDALVQAQRDGRSDRAAYAEEHIRALEARLVYLSVEVAARARLAGLSLEVDDTPLAPAAWGTPLPVDPGTHRVHAEAPGHEPFEQQVVVEANAGIPQSIEVPLLQPSNSAEAPAGLELSAALDETTHPLRTWGWTTGGVGLAALGVGGFFGMQAFSHWSDRNEACRGGCTLAAAEAGKDADRAATIATVGVSTGAALILLGTILVFYSEDAAERAEAAPPVLLSAMPGGATLSWGGRF